MNVKEELNRRLGECPLIAIIRGVTPGEAEAIGEAIFEAGIGMIEVPLNSPQPFDSIERIARRLGDRALVGAGTVLEPDDVRRVKDAGGRLIVAPNTNPRIISASVSAGLASLPGFFTPSEAFTALARISRMASSSEPPSSSSSRPLLMAPTGEMMSWQTRLQRRAARSWAERVKTSAI